MTISSRTPLQRLTLLVLISRLPSLALARGGGGGGATGSCDDKQCKTIVGVTVALFFVLFFGIYFGWKAYRNRSRGTSGSFKFNVRYSKAEIRELEKYNCPSCGKVDGKLTDDGWKWMHKVGCRSCCVVCGGVVEGERREHREWCEDGLPPIRSEEV